MIKYHSKASLVIPVELSKSLECISVLRMTEQREEASPAMGRQQASTQRVRYRLAIWLSR